MIDSQFQFLVEVSGITISKEAIKEELFLAIRKYVTSDNLISIEEVCNEDF